MTQEKEVPRQYWKISDIARALGVETHTLRSYEAQFGIGIHRNLRGQRRYTTTQIGQVALIVRLMNYFQMNAAIEIYRNGKAELILDIIDPPSKEQLVGTPMRVYP